LPAVVVCGISPGRRNVGDSEDAADSMSPDHGGFALAAKKRGSATSGRMRDPPDAWNKAPTGS